MFLRIHNLGLTECFQLYGKPLGFQGKKKKVPENAKSIQTEKAGCLQINENDIDTELTISDIGYLKIIKQYLPILDKKWLWKRWYMIQKIAVSKEVNKTMKLNQLLLHERKE